MRAFWVLLGCRLLWAAPLSAAELSGPELWRQVRLQQGRQAFHGKKTMKVQRQDKTCKGEFEIDY